MNGDGSIKHPGLDNHGMGTVFEELVRRFNEENNEEAGEHWTPRDAVKLMARLIFLPVATEIESGTYLLYDGACGTGGIGTGHLLERKSLISHYFRHNSSGRMGTSFAGGLFVRADFVLSSRSAASGTCESSTCPIRNPIAPSLSQQWN
jgi:type I restriction enzyme M protein